MKDKTEITPSNKFITKVGLPKIAEAINRTLDAYEDGIYDDDALQEILGDLKLDLVNSVDKRIGFLDYLGNESVGDKPGSGVIGKAQELYRAYREKMEIAQRLKERVKAFTLSVVESSPDIKFEGKLGKLAAQKSPEKLTIDFTLGSKTLSNLLNPDSPDTYEVPADYIKAVTVLQLDVERLKQDLSAGVISLPWARVERNNHLRVRR